MDILISSNLERLIYLMVGSDSEKNKELMSALKTYGKYNVSAEMAAVKEQFVGEYADWKDCSTKIHNLYENTGYVIDTHTAVAAASYEKYVKETGDTTKTVIASTASPFKFSRSVMKAIDKKYEAEEDFKLIDILSKTANVEIPNAINEIRTAPVVHKTVCEISEMKELVRKNMGL